MIASSGVPTPVASVPLRLGLQLLTYVLRAIIIAISKNIWQLRPFRLSNIAKLAGIESHSRLFLVECVEALVHCVSQSLDVTLRMQDRPRIDAAFAFTRLQNHDQSIKTRRELIK